MRNRHWRHEHHAQPHRRFPVASNSPASYAGRFAPSPTGPLHFGSIVTALASWLDARASGGRWLLRIEDLDVPRVVPGASERILEQLRHLGLNWDGEVVYQSQRTALYTAALDALKRGGNIYACACSRREIADSSLGRAGDGASIYPGTCRPGLPEGRSARAFRVNTSGAEYSFVDRLQGPNAQSLEHESGDFVLRRADGLFAYQLAVVVDDAAQGISDVVRGADLLDSTARQIHLQRLLGLPGLRYLHLPVVLDESGERLSKQHRAASVTGEAPGKVLRRALRFLGQDPAPQLDTHALLDSAIRNWRPEQLPRARGLKLT